MNAKGYYEELEEETNPPSVQVTPPIIIEANINNHKALVAQDSQLKVGTPVWVRWGYGLSFRAEGLGVIVKVFEKSVQVKLEHDVTSPGDSSKVGWHAGFVLKGIPRYCFANMISGKFNLWNSVTPIKAQS